MIDAYQVARDSGHGQPHEHDYASLLLRHFRVLPAEQAIEAIRESIRHTYGKKGEEVVQKNMKAVDETLAHLFEVKIPTERHQQDGDAATLLTRRAEIRARRARHDLCRARR